jgi:hypothetical protein
MKKETLEEIKESIEERVSCLILFALVAELIVLVVMIVFEYNKEDAIDFFYLYSVIFLILGMIYFAWSSVVKENAYELVSFLVISALLNIYAVIQALNDGPLTFLHWLALIVFVLAQGFYFLCFPFAYARYSRRSKSEIKGNHPGLVTGFKLRQHFESLAKLDFLLFCLVDCVYLFAIFSDWNFFHGLGLVLGFCGIGFAGIVLWIGMNSVGVN